MYSITKLAVYMDSSHYTVMAKTRCNFPISPRYESANVNLEFSEITSVEFHSNFKKDGTFQMKLCSVNDPDRGHTQLQQVPNTITNL
jgi:hypothetical protein